MIETCVHMSSCMIVNDYFVVANRLTCLRSMHLLRQ